MIAVTFTLAGLTLLMLQILAVDTLRLIREATEACARDFGHDSSVFPDYNPYGPSL